MLAVVLFHAQESYFPFGFLGVDVFFVISGFVVTPLILQIFTEQAIGGGRLSKLRYFYKKRFYRLAPALGATLLISLIFTILFAPINTLDQFSRQGIAALLLLGNFVAYQNSPDYFNPNSNQLSHTWSLSVEEQIYIFLPLIFLLFFSVIKNTKKSSLILILIITSVSLLLFVSPVISQQIYTKIGIGIPSLFSFYSPIERIYQFTLGGLGYLLSDSYLIKLMKISKYFNCAALIIIILFLFTPIAIGTKTGSIFASLVTVFIIIFKSFNVIPNIISKKLEWVGDRSYSIYLLHMPLIYIAKFSPIASINKSENRNIQLIVAIIVTMILGSIIYSKIENKFRYPNQKQINIFKVLTIFFILPLVAFIAIYLGAQNKFWGLDKNPTQPPASWHLDPNCDQFRKEGLPPCIYAHLGSTKTVLLLGDSHAVHLSNGVIAAARNQNMDAAIWGSTSCIFELNICQDRYTDIKKWIQVNKPNAIIISYLIQPNVTQSNAKNTLTELKSITPNILLVGNNPIFPDGKIFMQSLNPLIFSPYEHPKYFPEFMMENEFKNISDKLAVFAKSKGIYTLNLNSLFCKKQICYRHLDGEWLYRDKDHLSVKGGEKIIPKFESFLRQF